MVYPTDLFDLNLEDYMTLQWSAIESLFDGNWLEGPLFQWHRAAMEDKYRNDSGTFVYFVNFKDIPGGLNPLFLDDPQEIAWLANRIKALNDFTREKLVLIPLYHGQHWFLVVVYHIGTSPVIAILNSIHHADHMRYKLAARAISQLYPQLFDVAECPNMPVKLVQVPEQPNGRDCGIFVLSFIETILASVIPHESLFGDNPTASLWGTAEAICSHRSELRERVAQSVKNGSYCCPALVHAHWATH